MMKFQVRELCADLSGNSGTKDFNGGSNQRRWELVIYVVNLENRRACQKKYIHRNRHVSPMFTIRINKVFVICEGRNLQRQERALKCSHRCSPIFVQTVKETSISLVTSKSHRSCGKDFHTNTARTGKVIDWESFPAAPEVTASSIAFTLSQVYLADWQVFSGQLVTHPTLSKLRS